MLSDLEKYSLYAAYVISVITLILYFSMKAKQIIDFKMFIGLNRTVTYEDRALDIGESYRIMVDSKPWNYEFESMLVFGHYPPEYDEIDLEIEALEAYDH